jgi:hypothetical protein
MLAELRENVRKEEEQRYKDNSYLFYTIFQTYGLQKNDILSREKNK